MAKFPVDAPLDRVLRALARLRFRVVRSGNHLSLLRENVDGTRTTATIPNHRHIKSSTLRTLLVQARIPRDEFLHAYEDG